MKQVLVRISDEERQQFKMKVLQNNTSIQEVLHKMIIAYIKGEFKI